MQGPRNCPRCGKLFLPTRRNVCPACVQEEEDQYVLVRDYLHRNRGATPHEVSEVTEVPLELIRQFIKEGRLQADGLIVHEEDSGPKCQRCGVSVPFGRICKMCVEKLNKGFKSAAGDLQSKESPSASGRGGMRVYTSDFKDKK